MDNRSRIAKLVIGCRAVWLGALVAASLAACTADAGTSAMEPATISAMPSR